MPIFGGQPLYAYGTLLGLSFLVGWLLCIELSRRDGTDVRRVAQVLAATVMSAVLGSRLMHFVTAPVPLPSLAEFFRFSDGGMVAYGGMIAATCASYAAARATQIDWRTFADNATPSLALGLGITRLGCFLFGCDYGVSSAHVTALRFPRWDYAGVLERLSPAYTQLGQSQFHTTSLGLFYSPSVLPTQLCESALGFCLFAGLMLRRPYVQRRGELTLVFFGAYAVARFALEYIRGDADRGTDVWSTGFTPSQLVSLAIVLIVSGFIAHRAARPTQSQM